MLPHYTLLIRAKRDGVLYRAVQDSPDNYGFRLTDTGGRLIYLSLSHPASDLYPLLMLGVKNRTDVFVTDNRIQLKKRSVPNAKNSQGNHTENA